MNNEKKNKLVELCGKIDPNLPARKRLISMFDADSFVELDSFMMANEGEAGVIAGYGLVEGAKVYAYSQDSTQNNGAINNAHANKIAKVYELSAKTGCPIVAVLDSKGAKVDEANMLSAYSTMMMWSNKISGVVPQIAVVVGVVSGAMAMLTASCDFVMMTKSAELYMNSPFISGDKDSGTSDSAIANGIASFVFDDDDKCFAGVRHLLSVLPSNNLASLPIFDYQESNTPLDPDICPKLIAQAIADEESIFEINKGYANGAYIFLSTVAGLTTAFVVTSKSNMLTEESCGKVAKFVKFCDAFNIPIVTMLNSKGLDTTSNMSLVRGASQMASAYAEATTPKICIITGMAYGATYLALGSKNAGADMVVAWPQAIISALPPQTAVEFLWSDRVESKESREQLEQEYINTVASPFEFAKSGDIDNIIEPLNSRAFIINALDMLEGKRVTNLPKKHKTI